MFFSPLFGEESHFDQYFFIGLKPPPSIVSIIYVKSSYSTSFRCRDALMCILKSGRWVNHLFVFLVDNKNAPNDALRKNRIEERFNQFVRVCHTKRCVDGYVGVRLNYNRYDVEDLLEKLEVWSTVPSVNDYILIHDGKVLDLHTMIP